MADAGATTDDSARAMIYNAAMTVAKFRRWGTVYWIVLALILASCAVEDFGAEPNWSATFCSVRPPTDRPR
jgi:hypothetical protein